MKPKDIFTHSKIVKMATTLIGEMNISKSEGLLGWLYDESDDCIEYHFYFKEICGR